MAALVKVFKVKVIRTTMDKLKPGELFFLRDTGIQDNDLVIYKTLGKPEKLDGKRKFRVPAIRLK